MVSVGEGVDIASSYDGGLEFTDASSGAWSSSSVGSPPGSTIRELQMDDAVYSSGSPSGVESSSELCRFGRGIREGQECLRFGFRLTFSPFRKTIREFPSSQFEKLGQFSTVSSLDFRASILNRCCRKRRSNWVPLPL